MPLTLLDSEAVTPGGVLQVSHSVFETLSLFRTNKILKYIPCLGQPPQFYYHVCAGNTLFIIRTDSSELYTLFRSKTIPCTAANPCIRHIGGLL